jgi:adenylate cyclase
MPKEEAAFETIRSQLEKILSSGDFDASDRNRQFLRHIVEETLAGRADRIKAYTIATVVFGRGTGFDPQLDSIVRIEAGRLRRSLERYYLTAGAHDRLHIAIPKGTYVPSFTEADNGPVRHATETRDGNPAILVGTFEGETEADKPQFLMRGFVRELIVGLTRFRDILVFGAATSSRLRGESRDRIAAETGADFVLDGSIRQVEDRLLAEALLMETASGRYVWANRFDRPIGTVDLTMIRDEIANEVVRTIAQPHGALFHARVREIEGKPPELMSSYESVTQFHLYSQTLEQSLFEQAFAALSATVEKDQGYAEAFACLSQLYTDAYRFRFTLPYSEADLLAKARQLALKAIDLAPDSSRGYHALGIAYWMHGDIASSLKAYETGRELNPNDSDMMADLGFRYAMLEQWAKAMPLLEACFDRNPFQPSHYRIPIALYHFMHSRFEECLAEARNVTLHDVKYGNVIVAAAAGELGYREEASAAIREILRIDPDFDTNFFVDLRARQTSIPIINKLASGLEKAGLQCKPPALVGLETLVAPLKKDASAA